MSSRWQEILSGIGELEKKSPYNFCDRWCERCTPDTKLRCKVHFMEVGRQMTAMALGKGEEELSSGDFDLDPEAESALEEAVETFVAGPDDEDVGPEAFSAPEFEEIRRHIELVRNSPLAAIAKTYRERARAFLDAVFSEEKEPYAPELVDDLDVVAWYHTLLEVKIDRGLAGFHGPACEDDLGLYDAVGQFEICKKAVRESLVALRDLRARLPEQSVPVPGLIALLHHLRDHLRVLEENL